MPSAFLFGGGGTATASGSGTEGALPVFDSAGALADSPLTLDSVSSPTTLTALKIDAVVSADSADVVNGSLIDSPKLVFRGWYDSDGGAGVTATSKDITLFHDIVTAGGAGSSALVGALEGTEYFRITWQANAHARLQATNLDLYANGGNLRLLNELLQFSDSGGGNFGSIDRLSSPSRLQLAGTGGFGIEYSSATGDSGTAEAHIFDTVNTFSTTGAELISVKNNGSEVFAVDKDGSLHLYDPATETTIFFPTGVANDAQGLKRNGNGLYFFGPNGIQVGISEGTPAADGIIRCGRTFANKYTSAPSFRLVFQADSGLAAEGVETTYAIFNSTDAYGELDTRARTFYLTGLSTIVGNKGIADSGTQIYDSYNFKLSGTRWDGSAARFIDFLLYNEVTATTATTGAATLHFSIDGVDTLTSTYDFDGPFQRLGVQQTTVSLTADDQVVATTGASYIQLSSDDATATNRTFVLDQGDFAGHILTLEWSGTNAAELVDDSAVNGGGNHRLASTWLPTQYDTITLIWNGTDWIELNRATN